MNPPAFIVRTAVGVGALSPCVKSKRGVVIWYPNHAGDPVIVAVGHNAPAIGACDGSDTCRRDCGRICVHAEQAALLNARTFATHYSEMLHVKVVDGAAVEGGPPSCAECSKLILASGIKAMWLLEVGRGWVRRTAEEFHRETLRNCGLRGGAAC